ncbi:tail fiber assembly protein [Pantoea sp. NSTU24]|uniref:tail fiber assembly protein n=1 Tax=Pantoea sp. NSTU24 TaxID=3391144 RepID=UPI003D06B819
MIKTYALVKDGVVINTILWDNEDQPDFDYGKSSGVEAVEVAEGTAVDIGYLYSKGKLSAPPLTEEQKAEIESRQISDNLSLKEFLVSEATQRRDILQDAVDMDEATDEETTALPLWKKYRLLLSRIDANIAGEIQWPDKPSF